MSTRSTARNLCPPLDNPELTIRRRSRSDPTLLNNSEMDVEGPSDLPVPNLRTIKELCQLSLNGRGGPIGPIAIQAMNFRLKNDMIQQSSKVNGVTDDALHLCLFPYSLTHHAIAWFDRLPRNSINNFKQMAKMFLGKYFPPSMVTKLRNEITNFRGTFMKRRSEECYDLIKNMTAHHNDWDTSAQWSESSSSINSSSDTEIVELKAEMAEINKNLMRVLQVNQQVKAVTPNCETYGGPRSFSDCPATVGNTQNVYAAGAYQVVERETEATKYTMHPTNNKSTEDVQPPVVESESLILNSEPVISPIIKPVASPVCAPRPNQRHSIPYPSRLQDQKLCDKANDQHEKFFQIFKDLNFNISFADALILMPKFGPSIKSLLTNKYKLCELARTSLNKPCSVILLKKLPEKLGDRDKFLIPCDFPRVTECLALLANHSISRPVGVAKDVFIKVGTFHFLADFVVVDFDADPRVPLILGRSFLKTERALIDVFEGELTLRVGKEAITFNLDQTSRYSANYNDMMAKRIDVIDMACEEYSQEVLGFSDIITSGNPTPYYDPILSTTSPTLTPFGNNDFLLEEVDAFLALEDDPTSPKVDQSYLDSEGDILLLEAFLNDDPSLPPTNQGNYLPEVRKELKICEAKSDKSSIDKPPEVELKDLPPHLEYTFLEGDDKLPVIIMKDLSVEEKTALITVLKSHKRAIAWKLSDIKEKMLKRCEDTNLCLNWEKSHFMVKEGIVLCHKISKEGIKVDKAKVDVITKLPHPITVKGIRSFLGHAGFYRRFIKDFLKIARPMTHLLKKDTLFIFSKECVEAFQTLKRKLTEAPILIAPDWDMPFELMCDASDFTIGAVLGQRQEKHFTPIHYTNHSAIKYLFAKKDSKARLLRWFYSSKNSPSK
nr:reverse transcriptase domain-containing protein [Tanacetum cinerariifolium]